MTAQPSDYENKDGELAVSVNLLNEEGHLSPLLPAEVVKELPSSTAAVYIHDTAKFKHYIVISTTGTISWIDETDMETTHSTGFTISGIKKVVPLGNTLCILSEGGMDYLLWNAETEAYKKLDPQLPEIKLSFGLQCEFESYNKGASYDVSDYRANKETIEENFILSTIIKAIGEKATTKGKFCMPFFVRYAYRLMDGSLTKASAPILMVPNSGKPLVFYTTDIITSDNIVGSEITGYSLGAHCYIPTCELDMAVVGSYSELADYSDIIKRIEIFISAPIYTFDTNSIEKDYVNGSYNGPAAIDVFDANLHELGVYKLKNPNAYSGRSDAYARYKTEEAWFLQTLGMSCTTYQGESFNGCYQYRVNFKDVDLKGNIESCSTFYHLKSIDIGDLDQYNSRKIIEITSSLLTSLTNREHLPDDYDSHNKLQSNYLYSYNQRLIMGGIKSGLFEGYTNMCYSNGVVIPNISHELVPYNPSSPTTFYFHKLLSINLTEATPFTIQDVRVMVRKNGKVFTIKETNLIPFCSFDRFDVNHGTSGWNDGGRFVFWYYYPDADAYQVVISGYFETEQNDYILRLPLTRHDFLNGAYYFSNFEWKPVTHYSTQPITEQEYLAFLNYTYPLTTDNEVTLPNKLYTSEVLNPWYFPVEGIVTVGNGELTALSAATQALSQGQFGEFPLYAFCTDGVWALTVGATGYFTRSVPVSRDVCTNPESVLQIDDAVIYPTDRGLMLLAGSKNICFTEPMNNREGKDYESQLPGMRELRAMAGLSAPSTYASVAERQHRCLNPAPLREFLQDCKMIYDYVGQKIVVYNPKKETYSNGQISFMYRKYKYALVYSLKTNLWGMTETDLQWTVNSYPEAMGMTDAKKLVSLTPNPSPEGEGSTVVTGLFVTRPLKLGAPDVLKTVRTVMQRGMFRRGDVKSVMWGSRDLYNWYLIHSSQDEGLHNMSGTPYKYFIIGGLVTLTEGKSVSGASLEVEAKMTDVLR